MTTSSLCCTLYNAEAHWPNSCTLISFHKLNVLNVKQALYFIIFVDNSFLWSFFFRYHTDLFIFIFFFLGILLPVLFVKWCCKHWHSSPQRRQSWILCDHRQKVHYMGRCVYCYWLCKEVKKALGLVLIIFSHYNLP